MVSFLGVIKDFSNHLDTDVDQMEYTQAANRSSHSFLLAVPDAYIYNMGIFNCTLDAYLEMRRVRQLQKSIRCESRAI